MCVTATCYILYFLYSFTDAVMYVCDCHVLYIITTQCVFTNNSASKCGGALSAEIGTQIELDSCEFTGNTVRTTYSSFETGEHYVYSST
jgi:predicted outer membrane repeat protein